MMSKRISTILVSAALAAAVDGSALAADQKMSNMPGMKSAPAAAAGYDATGVVKQLDAAGGKVTIQHEAIKGLGWPAMTMGFTVKDKMLLSKLAVGKKVDFVVAKEGDDYVVTGVK